MNKLLVSLAASALAFASAVSIAGDNPYFYTMPLSQLSAAEQNVALELASAQWAQMTSTEQEIAKKDMQAKNGKGWTALDEVAHEIMFPGINVGAERRIPSPPVIRRIRLDISLDMRPLAALNAAQIQVARTKAKDRWATMSLEEQGLWMYVAALKHQVDWTALDELAIAK